MKTKNIPLEDRIILALDVDSADAAKDLVRKTESQINFFKVGLQLFMVDWFNIVDWIIKRGHKVMVDLKFFDIPETVNLAVKQLMDRGVTFATVHGNDAILQAALRAKHDLSEGQDDALKILAVTVLTSFGEDDLRAMGMTQSIEDLVHFRAKRALDLNCDGIVSSGLEAKRVRNDLGDKLLVITPGIRPGANLMDSADDQTRIMTAKKAIQNGADYLVVGRPITKAEDPAAVISALQNEIIEATGVQSRLR